MKKIKRFGFLAPSTCLPLNAKGALNKTARLLKKAFGLEEVFYSDYLFSSDEHIDHLSASAELRYESFRTAIRQLDLILSVAGGTGAEDLLFKVARKDYRVIRERRPLLVGFSDFTFMLSQIYYSSRVPVIHFPSLQLKPANVGKIVDLLMGREIHYRGRAWLTPPPPRRLSGIPIGGNLTTFVNFLNRVDPPKFSWKRHILFIEDLQIDVEDLHRLLAALKRHRVFRSVKGIVVGSLAAYSPNSHYRRQQKEALTFIRTYLDDVLKSRRHQGFPLPILSVSNFGHNIRRDTMAVPIGGHVTLSKSKLITFRLNRKRA